MEHELAEEIRRSLPGGRVVFRYFKDRFALQLLAYAAAEGRSLSEMRQGRFRPLLQKPEVRRVLGDSGGRGADWGLLDSYFPAATESYNLTLGVWGSDRDWRWNQTTRPGFNVVVQLNFPPAHARAYRRYIEPREETPFESEWHPINQKGDHTLAWARVDLDVEHGEALVEEIQSDWIRDATFAAEHALASLIEGELKPPWWLGDVGCDAGQLFRYVEYVLARHRRIWDQAVLAATLWLLRERLGIRDVYMHTHESGCALKGIDGRQPPRSVYERLPRSFCFERVASRPTFLRNHLARRPTRIPCEFWRLRI